MSRAIGPLKKTDMNNNANNTNSHASEDAIAVVLILVAFYYKYRQAIEGFRTDMMERLQDPFFIVFLVSLAGLLWLIYYSIGHHVEKALNRFNMWRQGLKPETKSKDMAWPFIAFDLQKQLDGFYNKGSNPDMTFLGLNAEKQNREIVSISDLQRSQHLQILGMTGTGKTSGVFLPLIYQDALKNRPVIILDSKGALSSINQLNALLASVGRANDLLVFSLVHKDKSCTYNPFYVGECDPQIVIDAFLNNFKDDNSFYRETAGKIFTHAFYILYSLGKPFTVKDVYTYLNDSTCMDDISKQIKASNKEGKLNLKLLNARIKSLNDQFKDWRGVVEGLNNYLLDYKEDILNDADSDIILADAIKQRKVVYFQLPTNAYPIQAVNIARMVQANLRYISSLMEAEKLPKDILVSVIIDEYGSFAEESFAEVLNKARSSGMMVTIAHQSLSDLRKISDSFMQSIDDNTVNKIYLRQTNPDLCELIAKNMGTYIKEEKTYRMTGGKFGNQIHSGESSNRIINEFQFPPDKIKNLHTYGQGYFIYRGNNTQKCVNFGCFSKMSGMPYNPKVKTDKKEGQGLFKKYYIEGDKDKPSINDSQGGAREGID